VVRTDTHNGNEQTNTVTTTTGCQNGSKNTESTNSSRERGFTVDQFEVTGIPLPSSRTALTGSKTIPMRLSIGPIDEELDATVQWNITPLGR
jgi:outer membrane receptor for ferric coprogen and ferric-rhodotorulic acid